MLHFQHGPEIALNRAVLYGDDCDTWILAMETYGVPGRSRVLDEFTDRNTAEEMLGLCTKWLASEELTQAYIQNTEAAIIDSWQDYSLIDWKAEERAEAQELEANPMYGMF